MSSDATAIEQLFSNLDFWRIITEALGFAGLIITLLYGVHRVTKRIGELSERMTRIEKTLEGRLKVLEEQINSNPVLIAFKEIQSVQGRKFAADLGDVIDDWRNKPGGQSAI